MEAGQYRNKGTKSGTGMLQYGIEMPDAGGIGLDAQLWQKKNYGKILYYCLFKE